MIRDIDGMLLIASVAAFIFGCVMLYSATYAQPSLTSSDPFSIVKKQAIAGGIGIVIGLVAMVVGHNFLAKTYWLVYAGSILLLAAVTFIGIRVRGTYGWVRIGGLSLQPVEFVKIGIAVALAGRISKSEAITGIRDMIVPLVMAAVPTGIVIIQNDLGSALVFIPLVLAMLWAAGADTKLVLGMVGAGLLVLAPLGYFFFLNTYQQERILTFLNPGRDPFGAGYNVIQSVIGIGSGGLFGKGFTAGTQVQLGFVPEHHSDFIFTVVGEELGFIGAALALLIIFTIIWRCLAVGLSTEDRFGNLLGVGIATILLTHVLINVGMGIAIMPCTGIPLPFFSAAGSSVMATILGLSLVQSVSMRRKKILF
jgi:rod shape determining protein RodA